MSDRDVGMAPESHPEQAFADEAGACLWVIQQLAAERLVGDHTVLAQPVRPERDDAEAAVLHPLDDGVVAGAVEEAQSPVNRRIFWNAWHLKGSLSCSDSVRTRR